jgi:hypothetical protein
MAAAATSTGPIGIEQINTTFYVWGGGVGFDTIQAAVDFIRLNNSGVGEIQVVHGHPYGENISTITGGGAGTIIIDNRDGHDQRWNWNGTNYVPTYFMQLAGFVAEGMPQQLPASILMGFSPTGDFGNGSGNLIVTADPTMGMPSFNLSLAPQDGTALLTFLRAALDPAGIPRIQMPETLEIYKNNSYPDTFSLWVGQGVDFTGSKGMYVWARPDDDAIDFQGETIPGTYDQTIRLNYLGGDVNIGVHALITEGGDLSCETVNTGGITAGTIDAEDATFQTCLVDDSPVRTFANTADGPSQGMIWPTIGIPVSQGDHWQNPSIDPATVPRTNTANTFTGLNTIGALTVTGAFTAIMNNGTAPPIVAPSAGGFALGWNAHAGVGETDFINSHGGGGGGFFWFNVGGGVIIGPTTVPSMALDGANTLTVNGDVITRSVHATGSSSLAATANSVWMDFLPGDGGRFITIGPSAGVLSAMQFASIDSAAGNFTTYARFTTDASRNVHYNVYGDIIGTALHAAGPANLAVQAGSIWLDYLSPNGGRLIAVGPSAGVLSGIQLAGIDGAGGNYLEYAHFAADASLNVTFTVDGSVNAQQLIINTSATGNAGTIVSMQPNMGAGANTGFYVGQSNSNVNTAFYGFTYAGNASAANVGLVGIVGGSYATFTPAGNWNFAGNVTSSYQFISGASGFSVQGGGAGFFWDGGSTFIDGAPNGRLLINAHPGAGSVCQVTGTFEVVGTKTFVVPHPFDDTKELIHACLEGPENGVYYRGEVTTTNGTAEIALPEYFEPLTYDTDRTVLLTQIFEDDDDVVIGSNTPATLLASRVKDGKFKIRSTNPTVKVYWEVKAVRRINVDRLEVERVRYIPTATLKETDNAQLIPQPILPPAPSNAGIDRDRTPEAGESQPQKVRTGDAANPGSNRARKSHKGA